MLSATICSDILAIRCIKEHICIGVGNCVHVFNIATRKLVAKLDVLKHDNIHGIVKGSANKLFVYGGRSLSICELKVTDDRVKLDLHSTVDLFADWIIAIECSHDEVNTQLRILFAHNNLCFYNTTTKLTRIVRCQEQCILYGGLLLAKDNRETVVFGGTVFQEILIWGVKDDIVYPDDVAVLHRLKGHNGVIFSIVYDSILHIISSTSDDRTIRLWRVKNKLEGKSDQVHWEDAEINLMTTMYGHTARVWRSIIKDNRVLSVGEDSLLCMWTIDGQLLNKVEAHRGAEIWCIDVSDYSKKIFTGGADSAVNAWPFESADLLHVESVLANDEHSIPKHVCYMNSGNIGVFMHEGQLTSHDPAYKTAQTSLSLPRYSSYCIMQVSPDRKTIGLASKDGYVELYKEFHDGDTWKLQRSLKNKVMGSKIFALHWLSNEKILVCGERGLLKLIDTFVEAQDNLQSEFVLPASRERWTTAAIAHDNLLICGDRAGSVYVFNLHERGHGTGPAQIFSKIHGRLGVQFFAVSGDKILSTGRDGTVRFYELRNDETGNSLRALHLKKMPMDWICRVDKIDADLYVLGFKEVEFMVYSMNLKRLVKRFVCGGGHRSWDCRILNGTIDFAYIRHKRVFELRSSIRNTSIAIRSGLHTKQVYCVHPIVTSTGHNILVSAGEDGTLRISCIVYTKLPIERYRLKTLDTYDGHISNVKSIAILNLQDTELYTKNLVFSGGGRAQLKVWEMSVKVDEAILRSANVTCTELLSYMLRGMDKNRKKSVDAAFFIEPETRFMDISAQLYLRDPRFVVLFVACSDGLLRVLLYDIFSNSLHLSSDVNYCNRCTLKVHSFVHEAETILLTMTTDGIVSFWLMSTSIENLVRSAREDIELEHTTASLPFTKMKIHQSGINSFDFRKLDDSRYLLFTGGDDNLISLVALEISLTNDGLRANTLSKWNSSSIHSAQITGAKFIGNNRMLSTGIDQRVIVYCYSYDDGVLSVTQIDNGMTFIPDVQGVTLYCPVLQQNEETLVCVYGKGLEMIVLDQDTLCL